MNQFPAQVKKQINKLVLIKLSDMKILLVIFFSLITLKAAAPDNYVIHIMREDPVNAYERIFRAVLQVECSGNIRAYNQIEEATGPLQIRPIRLRDYNRRTGNNYRIEDCYDFEISKKIFLYYASKTGYPFYESIARKWNGSGAKTSEYWEKIKAYL
jgi:hypothetical protein